MGWMSPENFQEAISHLQAALDNSQPPDTPAEVLRWSHQQRILLHAAQEAVLSEIEIVWHIEQVARGELHGE